MKHLLIVFSLCTLFVSCTNNIAQGSDISISSSEPMTSVSQVTSTGSENENPSADSTTSPVAEEVSLVSSAVIENGEHESSATISIYSDNSVEVLNFNYDGRAPDVYIAVGNKSENGAFERVALISEKIEGVQQDATLKLTMDDVGTFNAVSIYCEQYADDFGSSILEPVS